MIERWLDGQRYSQLLGALDLVFPNHFAVFNAVAVVLARMRTQGRLIGVQRLFYRRVTDCVKRHLEAGLVRLEYECVDGSLSMIQRTVIVWALA